MFDGYVKGVGYDSGSGKYITMQYGDYTVSYCHLSEIWVSDNQKVYAGELQDAPLGHICISPVGFGAVWKTHTTCFFT